MDSDHAANSLELTMEIRRRRGQGKKIQEQERRKTKMIEKYLWNQETKIRYAEKTRKLCRQEGEVNRELRTVEEKWGRLERIVLGAMIKKRIRIKENELGDRDWWDRRYKGKREMRKMYYR